MTTSMQTTCVWPTLVYRDARAAIRFLVDAFGFAENAVYGERPGRSRRTRLAEGRRDHARLAQ